MQVVRNFQLNKVLRTVVSTYRQTLYFKTVNLKPLVRPLPYVQCRKVSHGSALLSKAAYDIKTNVAKDVMLYKFDNPKFFRILNAFALCQFGFWVYLSHFAFTSLKDIPTLKDENLPWWRRINLGDKKYRLAITTVCFFIGYGILAASWFFTLKSVRFLVLRKGGQEISIVSYGPFGKNRITTVSLDRVSCEESRHSARVQLPLKVQGSYLFYMLDMRGEFTNAKLFDHTAGLKRTFKE